MPGRADVGDQFLGLTGCDAWQWLYPVLVQIETCFDEKSRTTIGSCR
jgi:hypothetical protein